MNGTQDLNLNSTECIARANDIGGTMVRNICSGAQAYIPWGSADWLMAGVLGAVLLSLVVIIGGLIFASTRL